MLVSCESSSPWTGYISRYIGKRLGLKPAFVWEKGSKLVAVVVVGLVVAQKSARSKGLSGTVRVAFHAKGSLSHPWAV